ncbi:hypothetical protein [Neisseria lactamica]|nr:hypothetical protein [Neisseria lactamica]
MFAVSAYSGWLFGADEFAAILKQAVKRWASAHQSIKASNAV